MAGSADLVIRILADTSGASGELSKLSGTLGKVLGVGAVGLAGGAALQAATDWQQAMARIAIAYNDTSFSAGNARFEEVQNYLRDLSTQLPTTASDLATIYEVAARYAPDSTAKAEQFTQAVAELVNVSRDLSDPSGTAQDLAKFLRIFNDTNAQGVASAIAQLSTLHTQGEGPVLEMAQQMALAGNQFGITEAQVLGLSNVLVDAGIQANAGGSSITRMFLELGQAAAAAGTGVDENAKKIRNGTQRIGDLQSQLAIAEQRRTEMNGQHGLKTEYRRHPSEVMAADNEVRRLQEELSNAGQDLADLQDPQNASRQRGQRINIDEAAKLAGESKSDFIDQFQSDPFGAFTAIIGGLKGMSPSDQENALGQLGIKNVRDIKDVEALVSRFDQIAPTVAAAQSQIDNPSTLVTQAGIAAGTTGAKVSEASDAANVAMQIIGDPMRKALDDGLTAILTDVRANGFQPLEDTMNKFDTGVGAAALALDGFTHAVGASTAVQIASAGAGFLGLLKNAGVAVAGTAAAAGSGAAGAVSGAAPALLGILGAALPAIGAFGLQDLQDLGLLKDELDAYNKYVAPKTGAQPITVNIGDIHSGADLQHVLNEVATQLTAAWNAAMGQHPVTGQQGGEYTTGTGPN